MAGWSNNVLNRFKAIPDNPWENDFYTPYNKLLSILFPADSQYTVAPQANPYNNSKESVDFIIEFHVFYDAVPVFIVEVKGPSALLCLQGRKLMCRCEAVCGILCASARYLSFKELVL